jgi:hypothetical protein
MMPGDVVKFNKGSICVHCSTFEVEVPAVVTIVGETDSFGSELLDLCQKCYTAVLEYEPEDECEWCGKTAPLHPLRDYDEGLNGPVYQVCKACHKKQDLNIREDIEMEKLGG